VEEAWVDELDLRIRAKTRISPRFNPSDEDRSAPSTRTRRGRFGEVYQRGLYLRAVTGQLRARGAAQPLSARARRTALGLQLFEHLGRLGILALESVALIDGSLSAGRATQCSTGSRRTLVADDEVDWRLAKTKVVHDGPQLRERACRLAEQEGESAS
jgi:hypothetical protein